MKQNPFKTKWPWIGALVYAPISMVIAFASGMSSFLSPGWQPPIWTYIFSLPMLPLVLLQKAAYPMGFPWKSSTMFLILGASCVITGFLLGYGTEMLIKKVRK